MVCLLVTHQIIIIGEHRFVDAVAATTVCNVIHSFFCFATNEKLAQLLNAT